MQLEDDFNNYSPSGYIDKSNTITEKKKARDNSMTERDFKKIKTFEECPFTPKLNLKGKPKLKKIAEMEEESLNKEAFGIRGSSIIFHPVVANEEDYDTSWFVKFFNVNFIDKLSEYGLKVLIYICNDLAFEDNRVKLDHYEMARKLKVEEMRRIYGGLNNLIENNIIARSINKDTYYVNAKYVYRGKDRKFLKIKNNY